MAISKSIMQRNTEIIEHHLMTQMDNSLDVGEEVLLDELRGASVLFKPVVQGIYNTVVRRDLKDSTKRVIKGLIKMCREMIQEDVEMDSPDFYTKIEQRFPAYAKIESTAQQCKKSHKNFKVLEQNLKCTFEWQVRGTYKLLACEDEAREYADLCRHMYRRDELKKTLKNQTDSMLAGLEVIDKDRSILKLPAGKDLLMRVLRKGFDRKVEDFQKDIDTFFC